MFYKIVENGYITQIGKPNIVSSGIEISEGDYKRLREISITCPENTLENIYRLSNETEEYVPCERTHEETVDWYVEKVSGGEMTLEGVPEDYRAEVEARLPQPEVDKFQEGYDQAVLDMIESGVL